MSQLGVPTALESFPGAFTTEYSIFKQQERDTGQCQLPVASASGTESCEIVDLHDSVEVLAIYWQATKRGGPPIVPSPYSFAPDHVFLRGSRTVGAPIMQPSAQCHDWAMEGVFYYALTAPYDLNSSIAAPAVPADTLTPDINIIPASNFATSLLAPQRTTVPPPLVPVPPLQKAIPRSTP
jgi:hypothetical protein